MNSLETEYLERYKSLSAFCNDIFQSDRGVSDYISHMELTPDHMSRQVFGWKDDYYTLKHLRWLRNRIVHDPGPSSCRKEDLDALDRLYNRFMTRQDPLAILESHKRKYALGKEMQVNRRAYGTYSQKTSGMTARSVPPARGRMNERKKRIAAVLVAVFIIAALAAICAVKYVF